MQYMNVRAFFTLGNAGTISTESDPNRAEMPLAPAVQAKNTKSAAGDEPAS